MKTRIFLCAALAAVACSSKGASIGPEEAGVPVVADAAAFPTDSKDGSSPTTGGTSSTSGGSTGSSSTSGGTTGPTTSGGTTGSPTGGGTTGTGGATSAGSDTQSGTRLKRRVRIGTDGSKEPAGFRDTMLGVDCNAQTADDGKIRCLPTDVYTSLTELYADANCTVPLANRWGSCNELPKYAKETIPNGCPWGTRFRSVSAFHSGTVYAMSPSCKATTASPQLQYFRLGDFVPASTFVEFTEELE